jgi:recombination protein RecT
MGTVAIARRPVKELVAEFKSKPLPSLQALLDQYKDNIAAALPIHMSVERMIRVAITAVSQSPRLQECNPLTICGAIVQSSVLGLEPGTVLGESFLLPFWNKKANGGKGGYECQLIVGYHGKIKLINNTGDLMGLNAKEVRQNDHFEFDDGISPRVVHTYWNIPDRGPIVGYWAGVSLKTGFTRVVYMSKSEAEQHKQKFAMTRDKAGKVFGVWEDHFDAMALKTCIHAACKYMPKSVAAQTAWRMDEMAEAGKSQPFSVDVPIELHQSGATGELDEGEPEQKAIGSPRRRSEVSDAGVDKITESNFDELLAKEQAAKVETQGPTEAEMKQSDIEFHLNEQKKSGK